MTEQVTENHPENEPEDSPEDSRKDSPKDGRERNAEGRSPSIAALDSSIRWVRIVSIAPLVVIGIAWVFSASVRGTVGDGLSLLLDGDVPAIRVWASELGWWAPAVTGVLMIVQGIAAPIPAVLVTAANSFLFGPFWGGLYSILTANLAAAICFGLGRGYGTLIVDSLVSKATVEKYESFFQHHGMKTVLVSRLLPFVPFDPISYVAGMVRMPFWKFFWATMIGQFPAGMAYSYLVQQADKPGLFAVYVACFLAAMLLVGLIFKGVLRSGDPKE